LGQIESVVENAVEEEAQKVVIYYSGYARTTGNWILSQESENTGSAFQISLRDIY